MVDVYYISSLAYTYICTHTHTLSSNKDSHFFLWRTTFTPALEVVVWMRLMVTSSSGDLGPGPSNQSLFPLDDNLTDEHVTQAETVKALPGTSTKHIRKTYTEAFSAKNASLAWWETSPLEQIY